MKNCFKLALAGLALATIGTGARADLSTSGAVGLPLNPTAQIPAQNTGFRVQANYFDLGDSDAKYYNLTTAVRAGDRLEVNGGYGKLDVDGGGGQSGLAIGAKYLFSRETESAGVRLAAGVGYNRALLKNTHGYVVASKYLGAVSGDRVPVTGHLGLRYDRFNVSGDKSSKASVFAGVEVPLASGFQVVGEIGSKVADGGKIPYSASVRYRSQGQPFGASIGIARQGVSIDSGLFAQIGYTFGGGAR